MERLTKRRAATEERSGRALVLLTVVAAPIALAFETLLRKVLFPDDFEILRALLADAMTITAIVLVVVAAVASVVGASLQRRWADRAVSRLPRERRELASEVRRARLGAFLLSASVPQVPAVLATVTYMLGAALWPVIATIAVVTVGVVVQAARAR